MLCWAVSGALALWNAAVECLLTLNPSEFRPTPPHPSPPHLPRVVFLPRLPPVVSARALLGRVAEGNDTVEAKAILCHSAWPA